MFECTTGLSRRFGITLTNIDMRDCVCSWCFREENFLWDCSWLKWTCLGMQTLTIFSVTYHVLYLCFFKPTWLVWNIWLTIIWVEVGGNFIILVSAFLFNCSIQVNAASTQTTIIVANAIMNSETLSDAQQRIMVEKLLKRIQWSI